MKTWTVISGRTFGFSFVFLLRYRALTSLPFFSRIPEVGTLAQIIISIYFIIMGLVLLSMLDRKYKTMKRMVETVTNAEEREKNSVSR